MKKRVMSLLLCLVMVLSLLPTFALNAAAADANGITNPAEATDETGDLHLTKELSMNNDGTYDVTMKAWATGAVETEIVPEQVPTDFVLVLDQSGSMSTVDMPTGFTKVNQTNFSTQNIVDAVNANAPYYYLAPDGKYYQVHERDAGTYSQLSGIHIYKQNGLPITGIGAKDGLTKMETPFVARTNVTGESNGTTEAYYLYKGVYYRLSVYAVGLPLRFQGTPFFTDANGTRHNLKTYTYTWGIGDLVINPEITDTIYKKTSTAYRLYYLDDNGNAVDIGSQVNNRSTTAYSGDLYKKNADESRLSALKKSVNTFIDTIASQKNADGSRVDHRVAIVGFASGNQKAGRTNVGNTYYYEVNEYGSSETNIGLNTELFDGATQKNYFSGNLQDADYLAALKSTDQAGVQQLKASVNALEANGATFPNYGLEMAEHVFTSRGEDGAQYTKLDGVTKDNRNMVVVMFTDGVPGLNEYDNQFRAANNVVAEAKNLKDMDAEVYTVGVFSQDDTHPLQYSLKKYDTNTNSYSQTAAEQPNFLYSELETYTNGNYAFTYYMFRGNNTMENNGTDTVGNYMRVTSSDYEDATSFMDSNTPNPNTGITGRGTATSNTHYMRASDTKALENVFKTIATNVSHTSTPVAINSSAVLKDVINLEQFAPGENYSVEAYTVLGTTTNDKDYSFGTTPMETLTPDPNTPNGTISVSGFDYSTHFISSLSGQNGRQLIVKIHGLVPNGDGGTLSSNDGEAKISVTKDDETVDVVKIGSPTVTFSTKSYVIDFNAKMKLATDANYLIGADENGVLARNNGKFTKSDSDVTYQLSSTKDGKTSYSYAGVDSALVFGKFITAGWDANQTWAAATDDKASWKQVNVVPASSVYFDDDFTAENAPTVTVGDGSGYNTEAAARHDATLANGTVNDDTTKTFQFTGTRMDLYCHTKDDSDQIKVTVKNADTNKVVKVFYVNNHSDVQRYNVPTVSFDSGSKTPATYAVEIRTFKAETVGNKQYPASALVLDGVRIYNPVDGNAVDVKAAYEQVHEDNAAYTELREVLVKAAADQYNEYLTAVSAEKQAALDAGKEYTVPTMNKWLAAKNKEAVEGAVFYTELSASGDPDDQQMNESLENQYPKAVVYAKEGPKNEVYLDPGEGVAFTVEGFTAGTSHVYVGMSVPETATAQSENVEINGAKKTVTSTLDMYYEVSTTGAVNIKNIGEERISITNVKITGTGYLSGAAPMEVTDEQPQMYKARLLIDDLVLAALRDPSSAAGEPVNTDPVDPGNPADPGTPTNPDTPDQPDDGKPGWNDGASDPISILRNLFELLLKSLSSLFSGLGNW